VAYRRTFTPEALVSILYATDETADTIVAAVMAHTHARRPRRIPIKLIVIAQTYTPQILAAQARVAKLIANVTFLDHQQLADHEPVTRLLDDAVPIIEMMAIPRRMTMGQALYLCLTGINIKYPLDNVLISVSDASVIVHQGEHYKYAISRLSRADTAVVSFPSTPRNEVPLADLLDLGYRERQSFVLPAAHVEGHCIVSSTCFSARGPELFNVLRAMEIENAGSRTFDWLPFFILLDPTSAKSSSFDTAAPPCTFLVHKHGALSWPVRRLFSRARRECPLLTRYVLVTMRPSLCGVRMAAADNTCRCTSSTPCPQHVHVATFMCRPLPSGRQGIHDRRILGRGRVPWPSVWRPLVVDVSHFGATHHEQDGVAARDDHRHRHDRHNFPAHPPREPCQCAPFVHVLALLRDSRPLWPGNEQRLQAVTHWTPPRDPHPCAVFCHHIHLCHLPLWCALSQSISRQGCISMCGLRRLTHVSPEGQVALQPLRYLSMPVWGAGCARMGCMRECASNRCI
jgi:hypothetical protein